MFGFVKPYKCMHLGLEVLKEVKAEVEDTYLFIAGGLSPGASKRDKNYVEVLEKRINELDLQDMVIFPNRFFPNEDIPYIFGASDIVQRQKEHLSYP
jgi:glycosyltransferase involved in cell wall biosynthesis